MLVNILHLGDKVNNKVKVNDDFHLAVYMLKNRFHTPIDLIRYWSFSGPCMEAHPIIEDYRPLHGQNDLT